MSQSIDAARLTLILNDLRLTHTHPGHFSMETPGHISVAINNVSIGGARNVEIR